VYYSTFLGLVGPSGDDFCLWVQSDNLIIKRLDLSVVVVYSLEVAGVPPMKKYSITIQEHQEYGGLGIVVDTSRGYFEPGIDGLVVAHDILEHTVKPHSCGYTDELMAIGGYVAGRVENCYNSRGYRGARLDDVSGDIQSLFTAALNEDGEDNAFSEIEKCNSYLQDEYTMNELKKEVKEGIMQALDEWSDGEYGEEDAEKYDIDSIVGWICKGYQLFKKRFVNVRDYNYLFDSIKNASNAFLSNGYEGQSATLYVNFTTGDVYIESEDGLDY
jgi:hypothetical protein